MYRSSAHTSAASAASAAANTTSTPAPRTAAPSEPVGGNNRAGTCTVTGTDVCNITRNELYLFI